MKVPASSDAVHATPRRGALALLLVVVTVGLVAAAAPRLSHLAETAALVPIDDPAITLDREITADFGMANPVVWVIEARTGTVWTPAMLSRIEAFTREVFTIPGVIADDVIGLASPNMRDVRVTEDTMEPVYLMGEAPTTAEGVAALRQRVDTDPNFRGTLVTTDGRAAMVVANFRTGIDAQRTGAAAVGLRDRYRDAQTMVYAVGGPVFAVLAPQAALPAAVGFAVLAAIGVLVIGLSGGWRGLAAAVLGGALAAVWTLGATMALGAAVLPWTLFAIPGAKLVAAAVATSPGSWRARVEASVAIAIGFLGLAVFAGAPAAALAVAGAIGSTAAVLAGLAARQLTGYWATATAASQWPRWLGLAVVLAALPGTLRLHASFGLFGYGARYLPAAAAADLEGMRRHFPPPTTLAVRFRGGPGFLESPQLLQAIDAMAAAARQDPAVVRVLSLADLVKLVNRAFNDARDEFRVIPAERALVARYLTLGYSPQFRQFADRGYTQAALWVYLATDDATAVERVVATLEGQRRAPALADVEVGLVGGEAATVLASVDVARRLFAGAVMLVVLMAASAAALRGWWAGSNALTGGIAAAVVGAGILGWCGGAADLLSLPALVAATATGCAFGVLGGAGILPAALATIAVLALGGAAVGATQLGVLLGVLLGAPVVATVLTRRGEAA